MATQVLITVDTELSYSRAREGMAVAENHATAIDGVTAAGAFGIGYQMERLEAHGLTGVFFVDPMPALVHGIDAITAIVAPIVARGHDVQLHLHSEWLELADEQPVGSLRGRNIADFPLNAQVTLLARARDLLEAAGATRPIAFRAGNFGANDDTLRALAALGFRYDSSFSPSYLGQDCAISLPQETSAVTDHLGVRDVPVAAILDRPGHLRHAQLCALSAREMRAALAHAAATHAPPFVIVSHGFELLTRDRERPNGLAVVRFEAMCRAIADDPRLVTCGFADLDVAPGADHPRLPPDRLRTLARIGEQAWGALRYERR